MVTGEGSGDGTNNEESQERDSEESGESPGEEEDTASDDAYLHELFDEGDEDMALREFLDEDVNDDYMSLEEFME